MVKYIFADPQQPTTRRVEINARFILIALFVVAVITFATYVRLALVPYIGGQLGIFIFFNAIVAIVAWTGGFWIGLIASVISAFVVFVFFLMPSPSIATNWWDTVVFILFFLVSLFMSWLGETRLRYVRSLEDIQRRRNEFVNIASHELRNPLSNLKLNLELLKDGAYPPGDPSYMQALASAEGQVEHMQHLIHDLLDAVRIQQGEFVYRDGHFPLEDLVFEVVSLQQKISNRDITIQGHIAKQVFADREKIGEVCANILSNAIKYSPPGTRISVHMRETGAFAEVSIRDYGIGIAPDQLRRIAEPFFRAPSVEGQGKYPGLGLGLYISNLIVRHYGGDISIASELGNGTTVTTRLPLVADERD